MAILKKWVCDGCGYERETHMDAIMPGDFFDIKVTAGAWGKQVLLCTSCHEKLLGAIDPEKWPRFAKSAREAA